MKRKNIKGVFSKPMDAKADPVIENNNLPSMPEISQKQPGQIKNPPTGKGYMPSASSEKLKVNKNAILKGLHMAPFNQKENQKVKMQVPKEGYEEQVEKKSRKKNELGYIVLRMRVQNGEISVIGSRKVEGPFLQHENLIQNGLTYEAFLKDSRIAIGSIPDYGEQRSFPRPEGDPSHEGHHITILPSFDFNLKVPIKKITLKDLPAIEVSLYRFKEHVPNLKLTEVPLKTQFTKEVRVVAQMNGIHIEKLHKDIMESFMRTFKG